MWTVCTTCKPFRDANARIQRNTLESWARLSPRPEVLVLGDDPGVAETCERLGFRHVPEIPRNEHGTPLVSGLFETARKEASHDVLAWVNSDIMLTDDLWPAVQRVRQATERYLMIVRRWNLDLEEDWPFGPDWQEALRARVRDRASLEPRHGGMDVFVYPRDVPWNLRPFAVGRGRWDSELILRARQMGMMIVDATPVVCTVHQNHDYGHIAQGARDAIKGPEAVGNEALLGGDEYVLTALNATHWLTPEGLRRNRVLHPVQLLRLAATAPALVPALRPLRGLVRALAPVWRRTVRRARR